MCHFLGRGVVSTSLNPEAREPPLFCCPRLLIQYIRSYPPYWRPFLHSKSEDAPCHGDMDPLITVFNHLPPTPTQKETTGIISGYPTVIYHIGRYGWWNGFFWFHLTWDFRYSSGDFPDLPCTVKIILTFQRKLMPPSFTSVHLN